jgi:predicted SAM-dependent methyltransferase
MDIMWKPPEERIFNDILSLKNTFKDVGYIQLLEKELDEEGMYEIFKHMKMHTYKR